MLLLSTVLAICIYRRSNFALLAATFFIFALLHYHTASLSLTFAPAIIVATLAAILFTLISEKNFIAYAYTLFGAGAFLAYVDLNTCTILSLGLPLLIFYTIHASRNALSWRVFLRASFWLPVCWFAGYAATWGAKWLLVILFSPESWKIIYGQIIMRLNLSGKKSIEPQAALDRVFSEFVRLNSVLLWVVVILIVICAVYSIVALRRRQAVYSWQAMLGYGAVAVAPFLTILLLSNQTYIHFWQAYRLLALFPGALLLIVAPGGAVRFTSGAKPLFSSPRAWAVGAVGFVVICFLAFFLSNIFTPKPDLLGQVKIYWETPNREELAIQVNNAFRHKAGWAEWRKHTGVTVDMPLGDEWREADFSFHAPAGKQVVLSFAALPYRTRVKSFFPVLAEYSDIRINDRPVSGFTISSGSDRSIRFHVAEEQEFRLQYRYRYHAVASLDDQVRLRSSVSMGPLPTFRIDCFNHGGAANALQADLNGDLFLTQHTREWMQKETGSGLWINGLLAKDYTDYSFSLTVRQAGLLSLSLRGEARQDEAKKWLPQMVEYSSVTVNGKELLPEASDHAPEPIWSDRAKRLEFPVTDGEVLRITVRCRQASGAPAR